MNILRAAAYLWTSPNSLFGLALGLVVLLSGGRARLVQGVVEVSGGWFGSSLGRLPSPFRFGAITLGHVILGLSPDELERVRRHEHVHVAQYERWGPLFIPAYVFSSVWQLLRGRRPYWDNVFEREAYLAETASRSHES